LDGQKDGGGRDLNREGRAKRGERDSEARFAFFFGKALPKEGFGLQLVPDGRNQGVEREKIDHFIPPRLARSNGSLKLP